LFRHNNNWIFTSLFDMYKLIEMFEPHIDENALQEKIVTLFNYRLFPELLKVGSENSIANEIFIKKLIALQTAIYHLDAHLEANWVTDETKLNGHWNNIIDKLQVFNIYKQDTVSYLNHIRKYEKHELELRAYKTPLRLDMEYFYFYKSCDVKLLRRLIYESYRLTPNCGKLSDWRYYDLVTEVNDDVEDLFEDLDFINGNRFLISLLYHGKKDTFDVFTKFLDIILDEAQEKYHTSKGGFRTEILDHTLIRVNETKILLEMQLDKITFEELKRSKLEMYMGFKKSYVQ
jgi:hypothetical protein